MSAWFTKQHHNVIAKIIREAMSIDLAPMEPQYDNVRYDNMIRRGALSSLALDFAKRFKKDNPRFNPITFLDACSPNVDLYPLSELWENNG